MAVKIIFGVFCTFMEWFLKKACIFFNVRYVNKSVLLFLTDILLLQANVDVSGRKPVSERFLVLYINFVSFKTSTWTTHPTASSTSYLIVSLDRHHVNTHYEGWALVFIFVFINFQTSIAKKDSLKKPCILLIPCQWFSFSLSTWYKYNRLRPVSSMTLINLLPTRCDTTFTLTFCNRALVPWTFDNSCATF